MEILSISVGSINTPETNVAPKLPSATMMSPSTVLSLLGVLACLCGVLGLQGSHDGQLGRKNNRHDIGNIGSLDDEGKTINAIAGQKCLLYSCYTVA